MAKQQPQAGGGVDLYGKSDKIKKLDKDKQKALDKAVKSGKNITNVSQVTKEAKGTGKQAAGTFGSSVSTGAKIPEAKATKPTEEKKAAPKTKSEKQADKFTYIEPKELADLRAKDFKMRQLAMEQSNQAREYQNRLSQQLTDTAEGKSPSLAAMQAKEAANRNLAAANAQAASARGGYNPALARQLIATRADIQRQGNRDAVEAQLAERTEAQRSLGQIATNMRGQDITTASKNADLSVQYDQLRQQYISMGMDVAKANQMAALQIKQMQQQQSQFDDTLTQQKYEYGHNLGQRREEARTAANEAEKDRILGGISGMATAAVMPGAPAPIPSDKRVKTDIKTDKKELYAMLDKIRPSAFEYKEPTKHGSGRHVGVMAQDLEKSKAGKTLVHDTKEGKKVDFGHGLAAMLAAQADLHKRLKKLEGKK